MGQTLKEIGDALLGPERQERGVAAIAYLVAAWSWGEPWSAEAQRVPAMFLDKLETQIGAATGARRRTLLEAYDLMLHSIETATAALPQQRPNVGTK